MVRGMDVYPLHGSPDLPQLPFITTASLACRELKIPRAGYYDDFGMVAPECLVELSLHISTSFNKAI